MKPPHYCSLYKIDEKKKVECLQKGDNPICVFGTKEDSVYRSGHPTRLIHDDA